MSDLISRQAAIDVLAIGEEFLNRVLDEVDVVGYERKKYEWGLDLIKSYISDMKELPPAQPAQPERIIHCKDCEWWTKQECSPQGRCALLQMYPTGGWFCGNARRREVTT